jgi:Uma2 family endonuclease
MTTRAALEIEKLLPATFTAPGLSEAEFLELCAKFPEDMVEYTADGTIFVMPPTDPRSGRRVHEVGKQLGVWADQQATGSVCGPDTGFRFADGSRLAPDAAWFDTGRWERAAKSGETFPVFAPEFVIEVRSPKDRIRVLREKMETYLANGVQLGWLIDPMERTVTIYRAAQPPQVLNHPTSVEGEGPVAGFVLNLDRILTS